MQSWGRNCAPTIARISQMRNNKVQFRIIWNEIIQFAEEIGINSELNNFAKHHHLPPQLAQYIVTANLSSEEEQDGLKRDEQFRPNIFLPILD